LKAIVGLGNPGKKYLENRHNIGFRVIDKLAAENRLRLKRSLSQKAWLGEFNSESHVFLLAKPVSFMNNSGISVARILARYKVSPQNLLVVYDDADLDLGLMRLRKSGSSAGHKGIASVLEVLGRKDISRLRIGIGRFRQGDLADYVLSDFSQAEKEKLDMVISRAAIASLEWFKEKKEKTIKVEL